MQRTTSQWLLSLLCLTSCASAVPAQDPGGKLLAFDPARYGFNFANHWDSAVLAEVPLLGRLDLGGTPCGLSGGMSMAAMDSFLLAAEIPDFAGAPAVPPSGSAMRDYLRDRQLEAFKADGGFVVRRLLQWMPRPTDAGVLGSSLQALTDQQFQGVIVRQLDAGHPVNVCLLRSEVLDLLPGSLDKLAAAALAKNHQVLAIGYRRCAATAGAKEHWALDVYDPDYPDQVMSLHFGDGARAETPRLDQQGQPVADPTGHELATFRAFFATPYTHKRPPWAPANAVLADASAELPRIDATAGAGENPLDAVGAGAATLTGAEAAAGVTPAARSDAMEQRLSAIEARLLALEARSAPGETAAATAAAPAPTTASAPATGDPAPGANRTSDNRDLSKDQIEALRRDARFAGGLRLDPQLEQAPNAGLKGRTGRLLVVYPKDAKVHDEVSVFATGEAEKYLTYGHGPFTAELIPGRYAVVVNKTRSEGIAITSRTDTRVLMGVLRINVGAGTEWQVFAPGGKEYATYGHGPRDVGLSPGTYEIEINQQREQVTIKAGAVLEY